MDFFARQDQARRRTKWLVVYFILAVISLIAAIYVVALVLFSGINHSHYRHYYANYTSTAPFTWWNPEVFLAATFGVLAVVFCGNAYKKNELAAGGSAVATLMGGTLVRQDTTDANERKLLNVVEEMSIASGVPMPQVYVLNEERGINAFAAGHATSDAAIGVTRGCIELLSRDELQGVIGHEFSHILNGDMRLNLRLIGLIFGLLCLATIGRILMNTRGGNSRDRNNALPLFGLALLVLGSIGVFGRLIQAAVSRQREFLADASSVQFTRNPGGLAGALQKIGGYGYGSRLESDHAPDLCHMFFGNGLGDALMEPMATHPPLPDRIRAIDPAWDGKFLNPAAAETRGKETVSRPRHVPPPLPGMTSLPGAIVTGAILAEGENSPPVLPAANSLLLDVGNPTPAHLEYAGQLYGELPETLKTAVREPLAAMTFIYALLLAGDDQLRAQQLAEITQRAGEVVTSRVTSLYSEVVVLAARARLPLVNLAIGSLRQLTREQFQQFSDTLEWLVASDGKIELFEFVLQKAVRRHLAPYFNPVPPLPVEFYALKPLLPDCAVVLSALAGVGSDEPAEIARAFASGLPPLDLPADTTLALLPPERCDLAQIDAALNRLILAVPAIKKKLLAAAGQIVGADGVITEVEAELLRAIADALDCPLPPMLGGV